MASLLLYICHPRFPAICLNVPQFCIGAILYEVHRGSPLLFSMLRQSASGQLLALQCVERDLKRGNHQQGRAVVTMAQFQELCVAAGMFCNFRFHIAVHTGLTESALQQMEQDFLDLGAPAQPSDTTRRQRHPGGTQCVQSGTPGHTSVPIMLALPRTRGSYGRTSMAWPRCWAMPWVETISQQ